MHVRNAKHKPLLGHNVTYHRFHLPPAALCCGEAVEDETT